jgi:hypothetical protein
MDSNKNIYTSPQSSFFPSLAARSWGVVCDAIRGLSVGQWRTSASLNTSKGPRDLPADARSFAGHSFSMPFVANAPRATAGAGRGRIPRKIPRYLSACSPTARPTRAAFLHIRDSQNPTFVVSGEAFEIAV